MMSLCGIPEWWRTAVDGVSHGKVVLAETKGIYPSIELAWSIAIFGTELTNWDACEQSLAALVCRKPCV